MSLVRSTMKTKPSSSMIATSPVRNMPSNVVTSAVASGLFQ
jgi:hypothetical protein